MAPRAIRQGGDEQSFACLIERSAELKRALVGFALSPRMERHLKRFMSESAGPYEVLIEDEAVDAVDRFALLYEYHRAEFSRGSFADMRGIRPG